MRTLNQVCWLLLVLALPLQAMNTGESSRFNAAESAFRQGDFSGTRDLYLKSIEDGQDGSSSLFYNLGTSLYKNGEVGAAIAAQLRAKSLAPADPDVHHNLKFLLDKTKDKLGLELPGQSWRRWSGAHWLGERALLGSAAVLLSAGLVLLGWHLMRGRQALLLLGTSILAIVLSLYPALSLIDRLWMTADWGAVSVPELDVLSSPTVKNAVVIFQLHEGAPIAVVGQSGDWFKIKLSDAKSGWVLRETITVFGKKFFSYQMPKKMAQPLAPQL